MTTGINPNRPQATPTPATPHAEPKAGEPHPVHTPAQVRDGFDTGGAHVPPPKLGATELAALPDPKLLAAQTTYHRLAALPGGKEALAAAGAGTPEELLALTQRLDRTPPDPAAVTQLEEGLSTADPDTQKRIMSSLTLQSPGLAKLAKKDPDLAAAVSGKGVPHTVPHDEPTPTAAEVAAMPKAEKDALAALGLTPADVVGAGETVKELVLAGQAMIAGKTDEAVAHLQAAAKAGQPLVEKAIGALAQRLPEPAKSFLGDPAVVRELVTAGPGALAKLLDGDVLGALQDLSAQPAIRDALLTKAAGVEPLAGALAKLGLTAADLKGAGAALPDLIGALKAAVDGDWATAAQGLQAAAAHGGTALVEKAIDHLAQSLPEGSAARALLTDPAVVSAALGAGGGILSALLSGDGEGALKALKDLPNNDALLDALAANPWVQEQLGELGVTPEQAKDAIKLLPDLIAAGQQAAAGDVEGALTTLQGIAENLTPALKDLLAQGINTAAAKLPDDSPIKAFLADPAVARALIDAAPEALTALRGGDVLGAVGALAGDPALRDAVLDVAAKDPAFTEQLASIGLTVDDLKAAGEALPDLVDALKAAAANDWSGVATALGAAAEHGGEALATKVIGHFAETLPEGSAGRALLTDPAVVTALLDSGGAVLSKLMSGDVDGALGVLKDLPNNDALLDALAANPWVQTQLGELGVTPEQAKDAIKLLPDLIAAGQQAAAGDVEGALTTLQGIAENLTPALKDLLAQGINTAAAKLPDDSPIKAFLADPAVARALIDAAPEALTALKSGDVLGAVGALAGDPALRDAVLDVAAKNPAFTEQLASLGLTVDDLKAAGEALPDLVDALKAAAANDWAGVATALGAAAEHGGEALATKVIGHFAESLPEGSAARALLTDPAVVSAALGAGGEVLSALLSGDAESALKALKDLPNNDALLDALAANPWVQQQLGELGVTPEQAKDAIKLLPDLIAAGQQAAAGDLEGALTTLQGIAENLTPALKELLAKGINTAAAKLPDDSPLKQFLADPAVARALIDAAPEAIEALKSGDVLGALGALGGDAALRDALLAVAEKDPKFDEGLAALGLTIEDLKAAGEALPDLVNAVKAAESNDWAGVADALQAAADHGGQELATKVLTHFAEELPEGSAGRALLTDPAVVTALLDGGGAVLTALMHGDVDGALTALKDLPTDEALLSALANNTWVQEQLGALGLTPEQVKDAAALLPDLITAGKQAASGDLQGALTTLQGIAENLTPALKDLLAQGINAAAAKLPDDSPLKPFLADPTVARALIDAAPEALAALQSGDVLGALGALAGDPALRDAVLDVAAQNPAFTEQLASVGLTVDDLKAAGEALPDLIDALKAAAANDWAGVATALGAAAEHGGEALATKVIGHFAESLPEGSAGRALLTDPAVVTALLDGGGAVLSKLMGGDVDGALAALTALPTNDALLDALAANPWVQEQLGELGLTPEQARDAIGLLPDLITAGKQAAAGDWNAALTTLQGIAENLTPALKDLLTQGMNAAAAKLPDDSPLKPFLADPAVARALIDAAPEALAALQGGDVLGALGALAGDTALRDAVLDVAAKDEQFTAKLAALGLTLDDLKAAGEALPDLVDALKAADANDWPAVATALQAAADHGGEALATKVITHFAESLPEGSPARALLGDPAVVTALLDSGAEVLGALLGGGDLGEALASLADLPGNEALFDALKNNTWVGETLAKLGLTPDQLGAVASLLPELIQAGQQAADGDWEGALSTLQAGLADLDPAQQEALKALLVQGLNAAAAKLPDDSALKPYLSDPAVAGALLDAAPEVLGLLQDGDVLGAISALAGNTELLNAVLDVAAKDEGFTTTLTSLGLTVDDLKAAGEALPDVITALKAVVAQDWTGVATALGAAAEHGGAELATKVITHFAESLPEGSPARALLTDPAVVSALLDSGAEALGALLGGGDVGAALSSLTDLPGNTALVDALKNNAWVQQTLGQLGITTDQLDAMVSLLPSLLTAGKQALDGDWQAALTTLQGAVAALPADQQQALKDLLVQGLTTAASRLPDDNALKRYLADPALVGALLDAAPEVIGKLQEGDILGALGAVAGNETLLNALIDVAASDPKISEALSALGLDATSLKALGAALPDLLSALDHATKGELDQAVDALFAAAGKVDPAALSGVIAKIAEKLPPELQKLSGLLSLAVDLLSSEGGKAALQRLFHAFASGDINEFGAALSDLGGVIAGMTPDQQEHLLNALGTCLPGKMGALFQDPELNKALAQTGSLNHLFAGAQKLLQGDFTGALEELGQAAIALLGNSLNPDDIVKGLENFGRLFNQMFQTLPNAIRNKIEMAVMAATANIFGNIPLIGDIVDGAKDLKELIDELQDGDTLGSVLAGAQLAVDAAKITQVGKVFTGPLELLLGIAQSADDAIDAFNDMKEQFAGIMMTGDDPTALVDVDPEERQLLQSVVTYGSKYGMTPEQAMEFVNAYPDLKNDLTAVPAIFGAAEAAGLLPDHLDQFLPFVAQLKQELGGEFDNAMADMGHFNQGEEGMYLAGVLTFAPNTAQWLRDQGLDLERGMVIAIFKDHMGELPDGRMPTEAEIQQYTQWLREHGGNDGEWLSAVGDLPGSVLEGTEEGLRRYNLNRGNILPEPAAA